MSALEAADPLNFSQSRPLTLGVELELQLFNTRDCDLTPAASDLIDLIERRSHAGDVKPEITQSMLEISTGIHDRHDALLAELRSVRNTVVAAADRLNVLVSGGGAHPFQHWSERRIFDKPRFHHVSALYGYLAKQFTVFGQHIHVGCANGDDALYLLHAMSRYVPHFIALAASSPYLQGVDTAFDSSRYNAILAFPLSGRAPFVLRWDEFRSYFERLRNLGVVESIKDLYWDIRPKPEFGTIEIRVCDTPLTVETAAALAIYAQALSRRILAERPPVGEDVYLPYGYNRFHACRFGLDGELIDPMTRTRRPIAEDIAATLDALGADPSAPDSEPAFAVLRRMLGGAGNDAFWMRSTYHVGRSLPDLVFRQAERWRGHG
jgi:glutamate---cysteine ligase / carboxylate-amine ligase